MIKNILFLSITLFSNSIYAAALPDQIAIRFINDNGVANQKNIMSLNQEQITTLRKESTTINDLDDSNPLSLPKNNVTPRALRLIISLLNSINERAKQMGIPIDDPNNLDKLTTLINEQARQVINDMSPDKLIAFIRAYDFLGIAKLKKISLSEATLTKLSNYVGTHPQKLSHLTISADNIPWYNIRWYNVMHEKGYIMRGHTGEVSSVAWRLNGKYIASGSDDKTVRIWKVRNGSLFRTLNGHTDSVTCIAWSPNGEYIASASADDTIRFWDAKDGLILRTLNTHLVSSVAWNHSGTYIASASGRNVNIWQVNNGTRIRTLQGHTNKVTSVAWSPDDISIASASADSTVRIWNAIYGSLLRTLRGHTNEITCVAWNHNGTSIASASQGKTVRIWKASNGELIHTLRGHTDKVTYVAWSPDDKYIASASYDKTVRIWDANDGKLLHILRGHTDWVNCVAWDPDGKYIASASSDTTVRTWNVVLSVYNGARLNLGQILVTWFILNNNDQNKITADIIKVLPDDLLDILVNAVNPNIAQKIRDLRAI